MILILKDGEGEYEDYNEFITHVYEVNIRVDYKLYDEYTKWYFSFLKKLKVDALLVYRYDAWRIDLTTKQLKELKKYNMIYFIEKKLKGKKLKFIDYLL